MDYADIDNYSVILSCTLLQTLQAVKQVTTFYADYLVDLTCIRRAVNKSNLRICVLLRPFNISV